MPNNLALSQMRWVFCPHANFCELGDQPNQLAFTFSLGYSFILLFRRLEMPRISLIAIAVWTNYHVHINYNAAVINITKVRYDKSLLESPKDVCRGAILDAI